MFTFLLWGNEGLVVVVTSAFGLMSAFVIVAVPLFIFMANMLERSGVAQELYNFMYHWVGFMGGGLAIGTVGICAVMAAMTGISGAATVTMGLIALPSMLERNYDKRIALGCIAAGGALGILIPPSVLMILYGMMASVSIGKLFAGGVFPGLLLALLFSVYIGVRCFLQKDLAPPVPPEKQARWRDKVTSFRAIVLPILLISLVLGGIFAGICTPTEAAGIGAAGSVICAAVHRRLTWQTLKESWQSTLLLTCMLMWIMLGASCFTSVYTALGATEAIKGIVAALPVSPWLILAIMQITLIILGCFLDPTGILMICIPIFVPVLTSMGFDLVWFGILFTMNMEMGFLTPPFGLNLFYLKGVVPEGITMGDIYRSIIPFVALQAVGLALVMIFPQIALHLPELIFK